jgi:hypothetical protein
MDRMQKCQRALGVGYAEFIHGATVAAMEECESTLADHYRRPLTRRELDKMMELLVDGGASTEYTVAWLRAQMERWVSG